MYEELMKGLRSVDEYDTEYAKIIYDAADAIEELEQENEKLRNNLGKAIRILTTQRWISVTERLPEKYTRVLVYSKRIRLGRNIDFMNEDGDWHTIPEVSYWMPLPEPPKEGE